MLTCLELLGIANISPASCGFPKARESQPATSIHTELQDQTFNYLIISVRAGILCSAGVGGNSHTDFTGMGIWPKLL